MQAARCNVAPHVGAWIETRGGILVGGILVSLPMWESGLKLAPIRNLFAIVMSLPMWERGLSKFAPNVTYAEGDRLWENHLQPH